MNAFAERIRAFSANKGAAPVPPCVTPKPPEPAPEEPAPAPFALNGHDLFGNPIDDRTSPLSRRFGATPFTIFNAREGEWSVRKQQWVAYGIESEVGRKEKLTYTIDFSKYKEKNRDSAFTRGTSVFDPVLTEMVYKWFVPAGGQIIDPFAGGSVRGIIAALLQLKYWGCDLSSDQIAANNGQADALIPSRYPRPAWIVGDSREKVIEAPEADFLFSCPPYGNLETYSDDPRDISGYEYDAFLASYEEIIDAAVARLRDNRFALFVVANFRDKRTGLYHDFVGDTVRIFERAGLGFYNEAVLVTVCGSAPIRAANIFESGRKLVRTHQNVVMFVKGDWRVAARAARRENEELEIAKEFQ